MISFSATLRSEWTKLTSLRSVKVMIALAVIASVGLTAGLAAIVGHESRGWSPADRAAFEPISFSMVGTLITAILFAVVAVGAATSEYSTGMARVTFAVTPRRSRVVLAKFLAVGVLSFVAGSVATVAMFLAGQGVLTSYGAPHASLADGAALRTVVTTGLLSPVLPVLALALGFTLRSTAGSLVSLMAVTFGPPGIGSLLPAGWQTVLHYLPDAAADAITEGHLRDAPHGLWPGTAAAVLAAWLVLFVLLTWLVVERRDA